MGDQKMETDVKVHTYGSSDGWCYECSDCSLRLSHAPDICPSCNAMQSFLLVQVEPQAGVDTE